MGHNYYKQDYNNPQRMGYFDGKFKELLSSLARNTGVSASQILSQIKDFSSFKSVLETIFSQDPSLAEYVSGMDHTDFDLFFNRPLIQKIIETNEEESKEDAVKTLKQIQLPAVVQQVEKKTRVYFKAEIRGKKVIAYETSVKVKGKSQRRYRDSKGRFAKKL